MKSILALLGKRQQSRSLQDRPRGREIIRQSTRAPSAEADHEANRDNTQGASNETSQDIASVGTDIVQPTKNEGDGGRSRQQGLGSENEVKAEIDTPEEEAESSSVMSGSENHSSDEMSTYKYVDCWC